MTRKEFLPHAVYVAIFGPSDNDQEELKGLAGQFAKELQRVFKAPDGRPLRVLCVGYGSGRVDLPVLCALSDVFKCSVEAVALEPHWATGNPETVCKAPATEWFRKFGFVDSAAGKFLRESDSSQRVSVTVIEETIEEWLDSGRGSSPRWDIALSFYTIHLFDDWKGSIAELLGCLEPGGLLLLGETAGEVSAVDGHYLTRKVVIHEDWADLWRKVYALRDKLHFPRARTVTPRSLSFLDGALGRVGIKRVASAGRTWEKSFGKDLLKRLLETAAGGPSASTMNSVCAPDRIRGKKFADQCAGSGGIVDTIYSKSGAKVSYQQGLRLLAWQLPVSGEQLAQSAFLRAVGVVAAERSYGYASDAGARIKRNMIRNLSHMADRPRRETDELTIQERQHALISLISDLREALALSSNAMVTLASRTGETYSATRFNLVPVDVIGAKGQSGANCLLSRIAAHFLMPVSRHFSSVAELGNERDVQWTNIVFEVRRSKVASVRADCVMTADGQLLGMVVELPEEALTRFLRASEEELKKFTQDDALSIVRSCFKGPDPDLGYQIESIDIVSLPKQLMALREHDELREASTRLDELSRKFGEECEVWECLRTCLIECGLSNDGPQAKNIEEFTQGIFRQFVNHYNENLATPSFQAIVFVGMPAPISGMNRWTELLFHFTESDVKALVPFASQHRPTATHASGSCRNEMGSGAFDRLLSSILPFIASVYEIEMVSYAQESGIESGIDDAFETMTHEVRKSVRMITSDIAVKVDVQRNGQYASQGGRTRPFVILPQQMTDDASLGGQVSVLFYPQILDGAREHMDMFLTRARRRVNDRESFSVKIKFANVAELARKQFGLARWFRIFEHERLRQVIPFNSGWYDRTELPALPRIGVAVKVVEHLIDLDTRCDGNDTKFFSATPTEFGALGKILAALITDSVRYSVLGEENEPPITITCKISVAPERCVITIINRCADNSCPRDSNSEHTRVRGWVKCFVQKEWKRTLGEDNEDSIAQAYEDLFDLAYSSDKDRIGMKTEGVVVSLLKVSNRFFHETKCVERSYVSSFGLRRIRTQQ